MSSVLSQRPEFLRPIVVAVCLTWLGEILIFLIWGVTLLPGGALWRKFGWTMTCGVAMGLAIGALVNVFVTGRLHALAAAWSAGGIYFLVLSFCVGLCYQIDRAVGFFGANEAPLLFILGGLVPALVTGLFYGWVLYSSPGRSLLSRIGL
jgi:hypothetical protein